MDQALHVLGTVYIFRGIERLLIECGAILCIVAGTLLYRWNVAGDMEASGGVAGGTVKLSHAAPGSVLALFGMFIMVAALTNPAKYEESIPQPRQAASATGAASGSASASERPSAAPQLPRADRAGASLLYADPSTEIDEFLQTLRAAQPEESRATAELSALSEQARALAAKSFTSKALLITQVASATTADPKSDAARVEEFHKRAKDLLQPPGK